MCGRTTCLTLGYIKNAVRGRQHYDWSVTRVLRVSNQGAGLIAIQFRHGDVQKNEIRLEAAQHAERLVAILRTFHFTPHIAQSMRHHHTYRFGIIDDGDLDTVEVVLFRSVVHCLPRNSYSYANGLCCYSICIPLVCGKEKLEISQESSDLCPGIAPADP